MREFLSWAQSYCFIDGTASTVERKTGGPVAATAFGPLFLPLLARTAVGPDRFLAQTCLNSGRPEGAQTQKKWGPKGGGSEGWASEGWRPRGKVPQSDPTI